MPNTVLSLVSGVAAFMKPPVWLQHGDQVELEIEKIGKISNRMVFDERAA
jgi:2-keto-4-pentenoate hydratase/2-oxohepta-3-ene-1,7-dioic acid hydratase in catechol pathway